MCEQCLAKAVVIQNNIIPGYNLMQSTVGTEDWPLDWYGIVEMNSPTFVMPGPILKDPYKNLSTAQINNLAAEDNDDLFMAAVSNLEEQLVLPIIDGYRFTNACIAAGYDYAEHGSNIAAWLMDHIATVLEPKKNLEISLKN